MGYPIASAVTYAPGAYTKSANLITGRNQFLPKGTITIVAAGSIAGMNCSFVVGGVAIVDDLVIPYFATTGALDASRHVVVSQAIAGGVAEFYIRNTTATAATTVDYTVLFTPTK